MAVTYIADELAAMTGVKRQPEDSANLDESAVLGFSIRFKGPYSTLKTAASGYSQGDLVEEDVALKAWEIQKRPGSLGVLSLICVPVDQTSGGESPSTQPFKVQWSVKSCRNDKSILSYCGGSARREALELWMKETDADALDEFGYKRPDGSVEPLNSQEQAIANKIKKGIDAVIRFYPLVIRKRFYHAYPQDSFKDLGFVTNLPNGAPTPSGGYSWLKVQDDCDENGENWLRTESWMGALQSEGGWDADLYGSNRWNMPLSGGSGS